MTPFYCTVQAELLKVRRSAALWLCAAAAAFVPSIILTARLLRRASLPPLYRAGDFWLTLWRQANEAVASILFPLTAMLLTSLVVQIEYRNNAWKQVHASPQTLPRLFAAKLLVILAALAAFFVLSIAFTYAAAMLPPLVFHGVPWPVAPFPLALYAGRGLGLFVDGLPIVAAHYALALALPSFSVPLGVSFGLWLAALGGLSWRYIYCLPYAYGAIDFLAITGQRRFPGLPAPLATLGLGFFVILSACGLITYATRNDRG